MAFSSFKFLSENKDAAKAAGKVGAKGASAGYKYAKENPDQVKKGVDWAKENPDAAKKAYQAGSTYAANNENPTDPKTMSKAAYEYAKENPEDAKRYAAAGTKFARENPDTVKSVSNFAAKEYGYDTRQVDQAVTAAGYYDKYGSAIDKYGPASPSTARNHIESATSMGRHAASDDSAGYGARSEQSKQSTARRPPVTGWADFDDDNTTDTGRSAERTSAAAPSYAAAHRPAARNYGYAARETDRNVAPSRPPKPDPEDMWLVAKATTNFTAEYDCDLTFQEGDIIRVLYTMHEDDNWWKGELYGEMGFFPACFIEFVD